MEIKIPDTKCKDIYCEVCRHNVRKLGWAKHLMTKKHIDNENGVEEVEKKQCWKCRCWRVLELYRGENATCNICLGYRESWAGKNPEKVRVMKRNTGINIRRRKRCITRNIARGKLNVKCVSVELGNLIGQDIWEVRSICWGAVVEKLVVMGGVGEDDTKGKARLPSTYTYIYISPLKMEGRFFFYRKDVCILI